MKESLPGWLGGCYLVRSSMVTRRPKLMIPAALTAVALGALSCAPYDHGDEPEAFVAASPDIQDVTIEHGEPARPERLTLCESPATFIPFEKPIERQVYDVLTSYKTGMNDTLERLTAKVVVAEAHRYGLDPWFVVGVMRVESRFYNFAESHKGARGLMQVMPFVGEELARDLGIEWNGPDTLYNPVKNVKMGVSYLALLNQIFKGDPDKILAAYNMGPNRVRRWIAAGRELPTEYSGLVQEYQVLLGNIGTQTIAGTDLIGRITMIERNMAKKREVIATVAERPDDVATEVGASLPAEPAIEVLDAEGEEPVMMDVVETETKPLSDPEPAIEATPVLEPETN